MNNAPSMPARISTTETGSFPCLSEVQHYARGQWRNVSCLRSAGVDSLFVQRTPSVTCCLERLLHRVSCRVGELTPIEPGMARWAFLAKTSRLVYTHRIVTESGGEGLDRVGYNELPRAERRLPVKQQMRLDSLTLPSLLLPDRAVARREGA